MDITPALFAVGLLGLVVSFGILIYANNWIRAVKQDRIQTRFQHPVTIGDLLLEGADRVEPYQTLVIAAIWERMGHLSTRYRGAEPDEVKQKVADDEFYSAVYTSIKYGFDSTTTSRVLAKNAKAQGKAAEFILGRMSLGFRAANRNR